MGIINLNLYIKIIFSLRRLYSVVFKPSHVYYTLYCERDKNTIQKIIYDKIRSGSPLMIARMGSIEMDVCENIKYTFYKRRSNLKFIMWKGQPNFMNLHLLSLFHKNAGFYPSNDENALKRFYQLMINCMREVDVLGSWLYNETEFSHEFVKSIKVDRERMTPLLTREPWTRALQGKKVLVIHPFAESIKRQYSRREKIFPNNPDILPEFDLYVLKAVQTAAGEHSIFEDWFEALNFMKREMDKIDYDVCLIGCGAYGFPLAAYAKECGKQAIHLGGVLQLLFGIKGKRWETDEGYIKVHPYANTYYNEYWIRPSAEECPIDAESVESGCYW